GTASGKPDGAAPLPNAGAADHVVPVGPDGRGNAATFRTSGILYPARCVMVAARMGRCTVLALLLLGFFVSTAEAIPAFARKYRVTCSVCHTTAPALNAFGEQFAGNGFEFVPGEPPN